MTVDHWAALTSLTEAGLELGIATRAARLAGLPDNCREAIRAAQAAVANAHNLTLAAQTVTTIQPDTLSTQL